MIGDMQVEFSVTPFSAIPADAWQELYDASDSHNLFYHHNFLRAAATVSDKPVMILSGKSSERLVFLLPFTEVDSRLGKEFRLFSVFGADHVQPLCREGDLATFTPTALDFIRQRLRTDLLSGVGVSDGFRKCVGTAVGNLKVFAEGHHVCPYIDLPAEEQPFLSLYKSKFRNNLKRKIKKAERDGLRFRIVTAGRLPRGYTLSEAFANLCRLHRLRFAKLGKTSGFLTDAKMDFHHRLMQQERSGSQFVIFSEVLAADRIVGSNYGLLHHNRYGLLQQGYDPEFAEYAPGKLLFNHTAGHLLQEGVKVFDFLRGDEAYKSEWATGTVSTYLLGLPFTWRGRILLQRKMWADQARRKGRLLGTKVWWKQLIDYELRGKPVFEIRK